MKSILKVVKVVLLRIVALISGCIGTLTMVLGAYHVQRTPMGFLELLGVITAMVIFLLFAIYCGSKADCINDESHYDAKDEQDLPRQNHFL